MTRIIPLDIEFDGGVAGDIAITAAEGGIGYWAVIDHYDWKRWTEPSEYVGDSIKVADDFVFYNIVDLDAPADDPVRAFLPIVVTPALLLRGITLYLNGVKDNFQARPFDDMEDLAAMDAAEADCVVQLGAFGRLIYG